MKMNLVDEQREHLLLALFDFSFVDFLYIKEYVFPDRSETHVRNMISKWKNEGYIQSRYFEFISIDGTLNKRVYMIGDVGRLALLTLVDENVKVLGENDVIPQHVVHQVMLLHVVAAFQYKRHDRIKYFQGINESWSYFQYEDGNPKNVIRPDYQVVMRVYDNTLARYVNIAFFIELEKAKSRGKKNRGKLERFQEFLQKGGYPDGLGDIYDDTIHRYVVLFVVSSTSNMSKIKMIATEKKYMYYYGEKELKMPVFVTTYEDLINDTFGKIGYTEDNEEKVSIFGI